MIGAVDEYTQGAPLNKNDSKYILQPQQTFELWDLDKVVSTLGIASLKFLIEQPPIGGGWVNCKVPMPSQILSIWLRNIGGDGIIFTSTQNPNSKNIAIFAKDDEESKNNFTIITKGNI